MTQVHGGAGGRGHVGPVVHDNPRPPAGDGEEVHCEVKKRGATEVGFAQLEEAHAARGRGRHLRGQQRRRVMERAPRRRCEPPAIAHDAKA